jgi:hypothetical protein
LTKPEDGVHVRVHPTTTGKEGHDAHCSKFRRHMKFKPDFAETWLSDQAQLYSIEGKVVCARVPETPNFLRPFSGLFTNQFTLPTKWSAFAKYALQCTGSTPRRATSYGIPETPVYWGSVHISKPKPSLGEGSQKSFASAQFMPIKFGILF